MSTNKQSLVPNAREALNKFKMEAANEVGVNLKQGYNGDLTSKQAGSVGGQMVNIMTPVRTANYEPPAVPYGLRGDACFFPERSKKIKNLFTTLH